jgi:hypothetical protein
MPSRVRSRREPRAADVQDVFWCATSRELPPGAMLNDAEVFWYGPLPHQLHVGRRRRTHLTEEMH